MSTFPNVRVANAELSPELANKVALRCVLWSPAWVQDWVQVQKREWLPVSCKRHQIGHLDF